MPSVPTYGQPQVREQALPGVRVNTNAPAEAFGGGAAQVTEAGGQFANQLHAIAVDEKQKADEVAVTDAWNRTVAEKNRLLYDPKSGVMTRKGKDAFGVSEEYGDSFDKFADGVAEELSNPEQRAFYSKMRGRVRNDLDENMSRHTYQESEKYEQATFEGTLATLHDDTIQNYQQPNKIAENVALQRAQIMSYADRKGMPDEWAKSKADEAVAKTYTGVMGRMLANGQDLEAKAFYNEVKDKVPFGDATDDIEKSLRMGSVKGESQRQADNILRKYPDDMPKAMDEAAKEKDPEVREALEERISRMYSVKKSAKAARADALYLNGANLIDANKAAIKAGKFPQDLMAPQDWAELPVNERNSLNNYASAIAEGKNIVSDMQYYQELMVMASTPATRDKFLKTWIPRDKFADAEYKELIKYQAQLRTGDEKVIQKLDGIRSKNQVRDDAFEKVIGKVSKYPEEAAEFAEAVDREIKARQDVTGKPVTNEEVQEIANAQLVQVVTKPGYIWNTRDYRYKAAPGSTVEFEFKSIPEEDKHKAREALQRSGIANPTEDQILNLYIRKQTGAVRAK